MNMYEAMQAFVAVAQAESFSGRARDLKISTSVISKRIRWLESHLCTSLFLRTTRHVGLTDAGQQLLGNIKPLLESWSDAISQVKDQRSEMVGQLAVATASDVLNHPPLNCGLADYLHRYPQMRIRTRTENYPISLVADQIDVLIGTKQTVADSTETIGVPLFDITFGCFASPALLKKVGPIKRPDNLTQVDCVIYQDQRQWLFDGEEIQGVVRMQVDSGTAMIKAACSGLGFVYMPQYMLKKSVEHGDLVQVLRGTERRVKRLSLYYSRRCYTPNKITRFKEAMLKAVKDNNFALKSRLRPPP